MANGSQWSHNTNELLSFNVHDFQINREATFDRFSSGDGSSATPYTISDVYALQGAASYAFKDSYIELANDIDATNTLSWNMGAGFSGIGNGDSLTHHFTGTFDGKQNIISKLYINDTINDFNKVGMFNQVSNATIKNTHLKDVSITSAHRETGGLIGETSGDSTIDSNRISGSVTSQSSAGGLIGRVDNKPGQTTNSTTITNNISLANVTGGGVAGGILGSLFSSDTTVLIKGNYSEGNIEANNYVGGIAGYTNSGSLINNSSAASVSLDFTAAAAGRFAGGIIGEPRSHNPFEITGNLFTGTVNVYNTTPSSTPNIPNSYYSPNAYYHGSIAGTLNGNNASVTNNFAKQQSNLPAIGWLRAADTATNNTLLDNTQISDIANYGGLSISQNAGDNTIWRIYQGHTAPLLRNLLTPLDLASTTTYNSTAQTQQSASTEAAGKIMGSYASGTNAGSYNSDLWSTQLGFDLSGGLTINAAPLTLSGLKSYDGTEVAELSELTALGVLGSDILNLSGSASSSNKNAGTSTLNINNVNVGNNNYFIQQTGNTIDTAAKKITLDVSFQSYTPDKPATIQNIGSLEIVAGDIVNFNYQTSYEPYATGKISAIAKNITLLGADANNYQLLGNQYSQILDVPGQSMAFTEAQNDAQNIGAPNSQEGTGPQFLPNNDEGFNELTRPSSDEPSFASNQDNTRQAKPTEEGVIIIDGGFAPPKLLNVQFGGSNISQDNLVTGRIGAAIVQSKEGG